MSEIKACRVKLQRSEVLRGGVDFLQSTMHFLQQGDQKKRAFSNVCEFVNLQNLQI